MSDSLILELSSKGYWPAVAMEYLNDKKYSRAIELCHNRLKDDPDIVSGRLILGRALYHSGQYELAEEQFADVIRNDPFNIVALRYMGDIKFRKSDDATAFTFYSRIQQISSESVALSSPLDHKPMEETKILTLKHGAEKSEPLSRDLRQIPFKTETMADLLLAQGHNCLALNVLEELAKNSENPQLAAKLEKAKELIKNKEKKNVS
ncbi:hypothetical protein TRIP_C60124 [Candidatus Zixiibacteriota bacterium]|nr:hypothetical protein TRIP_C60124 [candidate division Zixibacteria bacterium]